MAKGAAYSMTADNIERERQAKLMECQKYSNPAQQKACIDSINRAAAFKLKKQIPESILQESMK